MNNDCVVACLKWKTTWDKVDKGEIHGCPGPVRLLAPRDLTN